MTTFTQLTLTSSDPPFTDRLRLAAAAYLARFKGSSREHTESDLRCYLSWCAEHAWTRSPHDGRTWSCTSGGCRRSAGSSRPPSPAGSRSPPVSTAPASWTPSWSTHQPSTSAALRCPPSRRPSGSRTCSSKPCSLQPASHPTGMTSRWWRCSACSACVSSRPPPQTSPTSRRPGHGPADRDAPCGPGGSRAQRRDAARCRGHGTSSRRGLRELAAWRLPAGPALRCRRHVACPRCQLGTPAERGGSSPPPCLDVKIY